ncbi:MAG: hypothetical protein KDB01_17330 [Planctomycetaceae bacterium]|nr:hypothetical protein [Planctomycetaceae bacterium]
MSRFNEFAVQAHKFRERCGVDHFRDFAPGSAAQLGEFLREIFDGRRAVEPFYRGAFGFCIGAGDSVF